MEDNQNIRTNSLKAWFLAARPKTLSGAAVPVMIGIVFALKDTGWNDFQLLPATLCLLFAFIMQIDSNFINDYFDCLHGNDDAETRLGPKRACSEGWITLKAMRIGLIITTTIGCIIGLPLIYFGGLEMIVVGILCVLFAFLYTTKLSYLGLGDLLVLVFFGIVPVCITYYVIMPEPLQMITPEVFFASIACGLIIDTLLIVNNYRDRENDKRDGKMTLVVRIGEKNTELLYLILGIAGVTIICLILIAEAIDSQNVIPHLLVGILYAVYIDLHIKTWKKMKEINHGKQLNEVLGENARNMFFFGIITVICILKIWLY